MGSAFDSLVYMGQRQRGRCGVVGHNEVVTVRLWTTGSNMWLVVKNCEERSAIRIGSRFSVPGRAFPIRHMWRRRAQRLIGGSYGPWTDLSRLTSVPAEARASDQSVMNVNYKTRQRVT